MVDILSDVLGDAALATWVFVGFAHELAVTGDASPVEVGVCPSCWSAPRSARA